MSGFDDEKASAVVPGRIPKVKWKSPTLFSSLDELQLDQIETRRSLIEFCGVWMTCSIKRANGWRSQREDGVKRYIKTREDASACDVWSGLWCVSVWCALKECWGN